MKKITFFLFSLFCVVSLSVNAQDDGGDVAVNTCGTSFVCDGTTALGASWDADCEDGSDEILSYCCENNFSFYVDGFHYYDLGLFLDAKGIAIRTGHHCTQPLMEKMKLDGTARVSLAMYNTYEEIDYFIEELKRIINK